MTPEQIMRKFDEFNAKVYVHRDNASYRSEDRIWNVDLSRDDGEAKIEISIYGSSFVSTLERAYAKFVEVSSKGLPLKALPSPVSNFPDDEIPF